MNPIYPPPQSLQRPIRKRRKPRRKGAIFLAGSSMLAAGLLFVDLHGVKPNAPKSVCQQVIQARSVLSRDELAKLLNVRERSSKSAVQAIVSEPYCKLAPIEIRAGVRADREAYPLAFDPNTWLVVLYEGDEYAGYDFAIRR
ncbi:hypothetical protein H6F67_04355 [Microcoleus sp. FACHB-1515]|uniref:hypothetical protein n=1 Tax=Cyanophyceae TaxID=3028117 RepID=UPI00168368F8|nr:hypothetical protein [Microcoleus sp. FACHB-1515]MBD2089085.1 hypothetical protein [Microcoleus sp. FACHB-1515]